MGRGPLHRPVASVDMRVTPTQVRLLGVVCELVALSLIVLDIRDRREAFGARTFGEWLEDKRRRLADLLLRRRSATARPETVRTTSTIPVGKDLTLRWDVEAKTPTMKERITALEKRIGRVEERATNLESDLRKETDERQAADEQERLARESTDEDVQRLVQRVTAGNAGREIGAVILIVFGLLLTNFSEEIGGVFS